MPDTEDHFLGLNYRAVAKEMNRIATKDNWPDRHDYTESMVQTYVYRHPALFAPPLHLEPTQNPRGPDGNLKPNFENFRSGARG